MFWKNKMVRIFIEPEGKNGNALEKNYSNGSK